MNRTIFVIVFLLCAALQHAQPAAPQPHALTSTDLEAFLDGLIPIQMETADIAGAVVVVVKDGSVLFSKGYGYADVANKKPVSVDQTLFRPGSVGKLFTWTAVMQLVEQGKLNLDADVNTYLDFKIPDAFNTPITLRHLMTHSAGFEEAAKDMIADQTEDPKKLRSYLMTHIPRRIFPPGKTPAYSNYSTALAGYIVERASGKHYAKYVDESIFQPLEMTRSTVVQPLPKEFRPFMSNGYILASEEPKPFEIFAFFPAGSISSTGADMANFMIAHLQKGKFKDRQILRPETVQLMHSPTLILDKNAPAAALGFYEESRNGLRIIGHAGDTVYFHSDLHLIEQHNLGFFFSYNSSGRTSEDHRTIIWQEFLDRYFPYVAAAGSKDLQNANTVSGLYTASRRNENGIFRLPFLLLNVVVSPMPDGTIEISELKGLNGKPKRWREVKPFIFRETNGSEEVVFTRGQSGASMRMLVPSIPYPFIVYDSLPWYRNSQFLLLIIGFTIGVFLFKLILWPVAAIVRRHYGAKLSSDQKERRLRIAVRIVCALNLLILLAYGFFVTTAFNSLGMLSSRYDTIIRIFQVAAAIATLGTLIAIYASYRSWRDKQQGIWTKLLATAIALACIGYVLIAIDGNLFDFTLRY
jgi:CubicO group peptidase (beta-lactamase class C family)